MKEGLKIILFVVPQLFALFLKSNVVFSTPASNASRITLSLFSDDDFSNEAIVDDFKEYELEYDDDDFSDYLAPVTLREATFDSRTEVSFLYDFNHCHFSKLYILYNALKLDC